MRFFATPVVAMVALAAGCASTPASGPAPIPADILARQTCQEDIVPGPRVSIADDLAAAFIAYGGSSAVVIVSYDLNGSGKAQDPQVIYSQPKRFFDKVALRELADTAFVPGAIRTSCAYVRTYSIRPVRTVELPVGVKP